MAFRHISIVLADVMAGVERAATATNSAAEIEGGREPVAKGAHPSSLPETLNGGVPERNVNGKRTGAETPASDARGIVRRTTASLEEVAFVASLTVVRDMAVARNARPSVRRAPVSATVISMAAWRAVHSPTHEMRSGTA
jgi:hypothetical protein